ncbi:unnamed protein product [Auanema sp. JU1783]|nr:unnamed protein product [Auanema sp. JU1783]
MPKYYCDYCDTFLTHDSPSVRKTHNGGRKHKENVRMYYQKWMEEQAQKLVDETARAFAQSAARGRPVNSMVMGTLGRPIIPAVQRSGMSFSAFPGAPVPFGMPSMGVGAASAAAAVAGAPGAPVAPGALGVRAPAVPFRQPPRY